jgi:diguanylate cyclase (GGDEF)-like protein
MDELSNQQTILIVDDAKSSITVLAELLKSDFKVRAATSGEKALEIAFSDNPPDLILLDVVMPDMNGYEVCKLLKESSQTKSIPVIFITGKVSEEDEIYGFSIGAVDYITKPFKPVIVRARVNTHAELKRHRDYLEEISYIDGLTGIPNRRKFNEYLSYACKFAANVTSPGSMIMIDIDYFKHYNDTYGHHQGDTCLITVAQALSESMVNKTDFVARYGGEEFACILPNTTKENALLLAEQMRRNIEGLKIPHELSTVSPFVTVSVGVATFCPADNHSCVDLIRAADEALYRAKDSGRNVVAS